MEKVAGIMCASAATAANRVLTASVDALEQTLGPNLEARAIKLEATIDQLATKTATIVAEAEARANVVSAARADAKRTYDAQWKTIQATSVMVNGFDTRLEEIATTMARLCTDNTLSTEALGAQVAAMSTTQKIVEHQRETAIRTLAERFGDRKIKDSKSNKHSLVIPANLQASKGKQLIENLRTFTKTEAERFAFVMAEFNRTINDYDQKNQAFYKPPAIPAELEKLR